MKVRGFALLAAGAAAGFVLGTRAGRERYEQMTGWARRTSDDLGVADAVDRVAETARASALDLRDTATQRTRDALDEGARSVSEGLQSTTESMKSD
jgi:hypothetical protein